MKKKIQGLNWLESGPQYWSMRPWSARRASDIFARMGRHNCRDSCGQVRAASKADWTCHAAVISRGVMMVPCFSRIMGGVVTAPIESFTPRGRWEIMPRRFGANVNGGWMDLHCCVYKGGYW